MPSTGTTSTGTPLKGPSDPLVETVVRAVCERLGRSDARIVELVAREVASALDGDARVGRAATGQGGMTPGRSAAGNRSVASDGSAANDNGDGTITTPLGSVVRRPSGDKASLAICSGCVELQRQKDHQRAIVTATGRNRRGVLARVAQAVAEAGGDIQDVSQTIVSSFFTLIMVVDLHDLQVSFDQLKTQLTETARALDCKIVVMHEDVVRALQRV